MNNFLGKYKLLKFIQEEVENMNRSVNIEEIEKVTKELLLKKEVNSSDLWWGPPNFQK